MVRFSWHVEDGQNAVLPPGAYTLLKDSNVRHANCEIEVCNLPFATESLLVLDGRMLWICAFPKVEPQNRHRDSLRADCWFKGAFGSAADAPTQLPGC